MYICDSVKVHNIVLEERIVEIVFKAWIIYYFAEGDFFFIKFDKKLHW